MRGRKKLFRVILATICTGSVMAFSGMSASAYVLLPGRLEGGIYNRTYAIEGDAPFLDSAVQAFADWNWVMNPDNTGDSEDFYFYRISGENIQGKAVIYIYQIIDPQERATGITTFYKGAQIDPKETNWEHCGIAINEAKKPTTNYFQEMRKIINHEIGHCIGLEENPYDNGTIMYPYWNTCTAYCPTLDDITGVRAKY
jgi:hypothetical protein